MSLHLGLPPGLFGSVLTHGESLVFTGPYCSGINETADSQTDRQLCQQTYSGCFWQTLANPRRRRLMYFRS